MFSNCVFFFCFILFCSLCLSLLYWQTMNFVWNCWNPHIVRVFFDKLFLVIILHLGHQAHRPSYKSGSAETPNPLSNFAVSAVHYKGRIFMSLPRKQPGVVSTLNYVHANHTIGSSPPLQPYPNLQTNELKVSSATWRLSSRSHRICSQNYTVGTM